MIISKANLIALAVLVWGALTAQAHAQTPYPNKPITFIVPYAAGGGSDARSRQIAQRMSALLKQPIIVDNKAGAGGNIGTEFIAKAAPDGYTIGMDDQDNTILRLTCDYSTTTLTMTQSGVRQMIRLLEATLPHATKK